MDCFPVFDIDMTLCILFIWIIFGNALLGY